jgi:hypothetical protein
MALPFIFLWRYQKKTWCQQYCPRSSLYSICGKSIKNFSFKTPQIFIKGKLKWFMLGYFSISLFIITLSTIMVFSGNPPMDYLRFLIFIPIPIEFPQLITFPNIPSWITHLSYRIYSMMLTTTVLGLILAVLFKPRTWCTICPIATLSDCYLKKIKH